MNETLLLVLDGVAGIALGVFFFGGLWWTIRKAVASPQPALWFLGSLLLRVGVVLVGFYFISGGLLKPLLACLFGFILVRFTASRLLRPEEQTTVPRPPEVNHAA